MSHSHSLRILVLVAIVSGSLGPRIGHADPGATLPNVVALAPTDIQIGAADPGSITALALRFTTVIANRGRYPFDLIAQPDEPANPTSDVGMAYQCSGWSTQRVCVERRQVGRITWDPLHGHYHLDDFARYELRLPSAEGSAPNMNSAGLVAGGNKITFCMQDTRQDSSYTISLNSLPLYQVCDQSMQGISSGWADMYDQGLADQQILLNGVPDGTYFLTIRVNPNDTFLETTTSDDVTFTKLLLSNEGQRVTVLG